MAAEYWSLITEYAEMIYEYCSTIGAGLPRDDLDESRRKAAPPVFAVPRGLP